MFKDQIIHQTEKPVLSNMTSPVFFTLQELLSVRGGARILNLGASSGVDSMFSGLSCDIDSCDLFTRLKDEGLQKSESDTAFINRLRRTCRQIIPPPHEKGYDIVLCWDGFNYLSSSVFSFLSRYLVNFVHSETMFHMYFHIHAKMPAIPGQFKSSADSIRVTYANDLEMMSPAYTQADINKFMPRYNVVRSMLLQSGLQEYLMKVGPL
ncbi:hypothetical protein MNBD_GAMMA12-2340 [hydrothermal vent metagenome]|uniref:Uncharacterized protein n=1 Tax=hydrothermal vent metagenome TaxID=652676 RepID=A0A3B0Z8V9_9ZZZZ